MFLCRIRAKEYRRGQAVLQMEMNCKSCKSVNVIDLNVDPPLGENERDEISWIDDKKGFA